MQVIRAEDIPEIGVQKIDYKSMALFLEKGLALVLDVNYKRAYEIKRQLKKYIKDDEVEVLRVYVEKRRLYIFVLKKYLEEGLTKYITKAGDVNNKQ